VKPLDPRLLRYAHAAKRHVVLVAALGALTAGLVVAQALLLARLLAPAIQQQVALAPLLPLVGWLALVLGLRAVVAWAQERYAMRAATRTIAELREQVIAHAAALGPRFLSDGRGPAIATLATRGLDALEAWFVRYLPQLLLAATVTPATLLVVLGLDWISALLITVTLPLVPFFMILVGRLTQGASERRLRVLQRLGGQVLDLIAGLPTLRALGRAEGPVAQVRALGEANRSATMGVLQIAFLSGMVLELLTTLSVALVAVGIGLRLVYGGMDLEVGLAVLMLAPEVFLPVRQIGVHFHASTDGIAAAEQAFEVLETPLPTGGLRPAPPLQQARFSFRELSVRAGDRGVMAPSRLSAELGREVKVGEGRIVALTGASGAGKSTAVLALLGLLEPDEGGVFLEAEGTPVQDVRAFESGSLWRQITWIPQRPVLPPGTIREAVCADRPDAPVQPEVLEAAARLTGLDRVLASLPEGWDTRIGLRGVGLSLGQRQRVALTAGLLGSAASAPLVILDEPTAHLDARGEGAVLDTLKAWRDQGRTVLVVAHRPSLIAIADQVIEVASHRSTAGEAA